jgi:pimeloyl-ACP methyl ester carboxylesterase
MKVATAALLLAALACRSGPAPIASNATPTRREGYTVDSVFYRASGAGPALLMLHAFSVDSRMWESEERALQSRYLVVAPDLRGHGRTPAPRATYQSHTDVARVMDATGVRSAVLVGLSYGSRVAVDFALAFPDRVRGLVLASPTVSGFVSRDPMPFMQAVGAAARAGDLRGAARAWADTPLMAIPAASGQQDRLRALVLENARLWGLASNPEAPLDPPAIGRLKEIRVPTVVLLGRSDLNATRTAAQLLRDSVPGARLVEVDSPHMISFANAPAFMQALEDLLTRVR